MPRPRPAPALSRRWGLICGGCLLLSPGTALALTADEAWNGWRDAAGHRGKDEGHGHDRAQHTRQAIAGARDHEGEGDAEHDAARRREQPRLQRQPQRGDRLLRPRRRDARGRDPGAVRWRAMSGRKRSGGGGSSAPIGSIWLSQPGCVYVWRPLSEPSTNRSASPSRATVARAPEPMHGRLSEVTVLQPEDPILVPSGRAWRAGSVCACFSHAVRRPKSIRKCDGTTCGRELLLPKGRHSTNFPCPIETIAVCAKDERVSSRRRLQSSAPR